GLEDMHLKETLLKTKDLTLQKTVEICQSNDIARAQLTEMNRKSVDVNLITRTGNANKPLPSRTQTSTGYMKNHNNIGRQGKFPAPQITQRQTTAKATSSSSTFQCYRCGTLHGKN